MIEKGRHKARAQGFEFGVSPNKGTKFIRVPFQTESGESVNWDGYFTEKTLDRTMDSLEHMGWDGQSLSAPRGIGDQDCYIVVDHETHEGKTYAKVQWVNSLNGGGLKEEIKMDAQTLSALDDEFKADLLKRRQKNAGRPTPQTRQSSREYDPDSDDVPF